MSLRAIRWAWSQTLLLSPIQILVLVALADYANDAQTCWPTLATLAKKTRLSRRAVINAVAHLVEVNLVTRVCRGPQQSPLYILAVQDDVVPSTARQTMSAGVAGQAADEALSGVKERHGVQEMHGVQGMHGVQEIHGVHLVQGGERGAPPAVQEVPVEVSLVQGGSARGALPGVHEVHPNLPIEPIKETSLLSAAPAACETPEAHTEDQEIKPPPPADANPSQATLQRWLEVLSQAGFTPKSLGTPAILAGIRQWLNHGITDDDIHDALLIARARLDGELPKSPAYLLKIMPSLRQEKQQASQQWDSDRVGSASMTGSPSHSKHDEGNPYESHRRLAPLSSAERMRQAGIAYLRRRGVLTSETSGMVERPSDGDAVDTDGGDLSPQMVFEVG